MGQPLRAHITLREYEELPDDGFRYELVEGDLTMTPAPEPRHETASVNLVFILERWRRAGGGGGRGMVFTAPVDVVLAFDTVVQPDLVYVSGERAATIVGKRIQGPPDLAVEVFYTQRADRDRVVKLNLYAKYRIREYWLIDLDAHTVTILTLGSDGYEVSTSGSGDVGLASPGLEGLVVVPAEVFDRVP